MVMGGCMLHLELATGVYSVAHAHGLQVEDVNLDGSCWVPVVEVRSSSITTALCSVSSKPILH